MKHLYNLIKVAQKININQQVEDVISKFNWLSTSANREVSVPCADLSRNLERCLKSSDKKLKIEIIDYALNQIPSIQEKSDDNAEIGVLGQIKQQLIKIERMLLKQK